MGTTFVTIDSVGDADRGFWMRDGVLEIWLRLLSLHIPEPLPDQVDADRIRDIRDAWLLASKGFFGGHVPHQLETFCSTQTGLDTIHSAIDSLMVALHSTGDEIHGPTLNLLGVEGKQLATIDRDRLIDVGNAFRDLLNGRITSTATSTEYMPGCTKRG